MVSQIHEGVIESSSLDVMGFHQINPNIPAVGVTALKRFIEALPSRGDAFAILAVNFWTP